MHEKDIKRMVVKQLKQKHPNWKALTRKKKIVLAQQVLDEVVKDYPFDQAVMVPLNELTGIPAIELAKIMSLDDIAHFIVQQNGQILPFPPFSRKKKTYISDPELRAIDELLDDIILDKLLAPSGFTPSMRSIFPHHLLRAELLKSLKFPEISYRKYCTSQLNNLEQKTNRAFVGLPLHRKLSISHSQLSQFRGGLTFSQQVNILVYVIHLLQESGVFENKFIVHGADSSELAAICNPRPLATINIGKKKVRIYDQLDADCGKRRKKRDKSEYFVGYRIHTLTAIDPQSGHSYPLISLLAPGNHHDSLFLKQLIQLGKAIGIDIAVISADEAYGDAQENQDIQKEFNVTIITPASKKVKIPEFVDQEGLSVYRDSWCEEPMRYLGKTDEGLHEFKCNASAGECIHSTDCDKSRYISVDAGMFGQIPTQVRGVAEVENLRKNVERAFNLLKHREGLEPVRVRSQHGLMAVATFANMATLLLEIVATRKTKTKENNRQLKLEFKSAA